MNRFAHIVGGVVSHRINGHIQGFSIQISSRILPLSPQARHAVHFPFQVDFVPENGSRTPCVFKINTDVVSISFLLVIRISNKRIQTLAIALKLDCGSHLVLYMNARWMWSAANRPSWRANIQLFDTLTIILTLHIPSWMSFSNDAISALFLSTNTCRFFPFRIEPPHVH